jgi:hypothetical protein
MMQAYSSVFTPRAPSGEGLAGPSREVTVARAELLRLPACRGLRIACLSGCAWLTIERQWQDIVLERGEVLVLNDKAPVFVSGLPEARLRLTPA